MRTLSDILVTGTIPELEARKNSLIAYKHKLDKERYGRDEAIDVQGDIYDVEDRIKELGGR